jgi:hypothetical protein
MSIERITFDKSNYQDLIALAEKLKESNERRIKVVVEDDLLPLLITQGNTLSYHFIRLQIKIDELFETDIVEELNWYKKELKEIGLKELNDGAIEWVPLSKKLRRYIAPLRGLSNGLFFGLLKHQLEPLGIYFMSEKETLQRYGHKRKVLIKR